MSRAYEYYRESNQKQDLDEIYAEEFRTYYGFECPPNMGLPGHDNVHVQSHLRGWNDRAGKLEKTTTHLESRERVRIHGSEERKLHEHKRDETCESNLSTRGKVA